MPTTKMRLNISVDDDMQRSLSFLARRDRIPRATKAARLLEIALEMEEDRVWDELAQRRDTKNARYISHANAWK